MKRIIALAICLSMVGTSAVYASGVNDAAGVLVKGDFKYYSLRQAAQAAGSTVTWNAEKRAIVLSNKGKEMELYPGFGWFKLNGAYTALKQPLVIENGISYLNSGLLGQLTEAGFVSAGAGSSTTEGVVKKQSVEGLIASGIAHDNDLRILRNTVNKTQETLTEVERGAAQILPYTGNGATDLQVNTTWLSILGTRVQEDIAKKGIINRQDVLTLQISALYDGLIAAMDSEVLYQELVSNAMKTLTETQLKFENGLVSSLDYDKAKNALETAKSNLLIQQATIKDTRNSLSSLTGIAADQIVPSGTVSITPLKGFNLDGAYNEAVANSYSLYVLGKNSLMAKYGVDYYVFNAGAAPYKAKELDLSNAQIEVDKEKERIRKALLSTWQEIIQAEETDRSLKVQIDEKQRDLDTLRLQKSLGLITDQQFRTAWLGVKQLELSREANSIKHRQAIRILAKPWLSQ